MNSAEAELVLKELERRRTEQKFLHDNIWSLYKATGYAFDKVQVKDVHHRLSEELNVPLSHQFRRQITDIILRKGLHIVFIHGKRHYRGLKKL